LDDVHTTLGRAQASPSASLRVETGAAAATGLLIPALPDFCARYPDIELMSVRFCSKAANYAGSGP
jgi:DNA-binding transcriptional LysR family regulator